MSNFKKERGNIFENFLFWKTDHESTSLLGNNYYSVAYNMINVKMFDKFMILDCFWAHNLMALINISELGPERFTIN